MKKIKVLALIFVTSLLAGVVFSNHNVSAAVDNAAIMKKWIFTQYIRCANSDTTMAKSFQSKNDDSLVGDSVFYNAGTVYLPSYNFQNTADGNAINCRELALGNDKISNQGAFSYGGYNDVKWSSSNADTMLKNIGYDFNANGDPFINVAMHYTMEYNAGFFGSGASDGALTQRNGTLTQDASGNYSIDYDGSFLSFGDILSFSVNNNTKKLRVTAGIPFYLGFVHGCKFVDPVWTEKEIDLSNNLNGTLNNIKGISGSYWNVECNKNGISAKFKYQIDDSTISAGESGEYTYDNNKTMNAVKNLSGLDGNGLFLTPSEKYVLYVYYLENAAPGTGLNDKAVCGGDSPGGTYVKIRLKDSNGEFNENCYVNLGGVDPSEIVVYTQGASGNLPVIETITLQEIIDWLNTVDTSSLDDVPTVDNINSDVSGGNGEDDKTEITCANSGAADSLGWILCPALTFLSNAANTIYEDYLEPALRIEPKLFNSGAGGQSDVHYAWGIFQGIANTFFIILLLIVIFSQLTGVGIDNYGIKKILPKLILMAVLINLSYIICLVCVDISNILGNGFQNLFDSMSPELPSTISVIEGGEGFKLSQLGPTLLTGAGLLAALATFIWPIVANGNGVMGILLALLTAAIAIVISVLFLFILLAAREAAIIALMVISPVAFACYILPNTKKYYDKWYQAWKALLFLYPICGIMVGGGNFVSKLLLAAGGATGGFFTAFMAMIIGVVPIFFIPSLLRSSLSAIGNIGAKISGIGKSVGRRLSSDTDKNIRNSKAYQERQQFNQERSAMRRANKVRNRLGGRANLSERQIMKLSKANEQYLASENQRQQGRINADENYVSAKLAKQTVDNEENRENVILDGSAPVIQMQHDKGENERMKKQQEATVGVVPLNPEIIRRELENQRIQLEEEQDVNINLKPLLDRENVRTKIQNATNEAIAENGSDDGTIAPVRVLPVTAEAASQRRQAARDAQEFKAFQDQFAGMDQDQLRELATDPATGAHTWFNPTDASSQQRMRALISTMNANGMENDVFRMLNATDVSGSAAVMSELANSSNKVMRAYGKGGANVSYHDFMTQAYTDTDGNVHSSRMQKYVEDKGTDFLNGLDDKALRQIEVNSTPGNEIMSTELLMNAAAQINSQDAINHVDNMLQTRNDINMTGDQYVKLNDSTAQMLNTRATTATDAGRVQIERAILSASDQIAQDPQTINKLGSTKRRIANDRRTARTDGGSTAEI